jgi:hypothetical protein
MTISFARHQFPPALIRHAVWLYVRFTLSYRDVEDLLAERGLDVPYETVRRWVLKFRPRFARELHRRRPRPTSQWHLAEMAVMIAGRQFWLWRAVDEGEVLDLSPPANGRSTPRVRATQSGRSNNPDAVDLAMRGWATMYLRRGVHRRVRVVALDEAVLGFHDAAFGIDEVLLRFGIGYVGRRGGGLSRVLAPSPGGPCRRSPARWPATTAVGRSSRGGTSCS